MSQQARNWVIEKSTHKGLELFCFYMLADEMNSRGEGSYASVSHLCRLMRMQRRSVQRFLRRIEASGELRCLTRGKGRANTVWQIPGVVGDGFYNVSRGDPQSPQRRPTDTSEATHGHLRGDPRSPNPKPIGKTSKTGAPLIPPPPPVQVGEGEKASGNGLKDAPPDLCDYLGTAHLGFDILAANRLWTACVSARPATSASDVIKAVEFKRQNLGGSRSPVAVLISTVPAILKEWMKFDAH